MQSPATQIKVTHESWPIRGSFTISRGSRTTAEVLLVTLQTGGCVGRGEAVPYARYGETMEQSQAELEARLKRMEEDGS